MAHDMETGEIPKTTGPVPTHVAIIMDGNGRWAEARGEARHAGHRAGVASVRSTIEECIRQGIDVLTRHAIEGYTGSAGYMPPKGGQIQLSDEEVTAAVEYMVDNSKD